MSARPKVLCTVAWLAEEAERILADAVVGDRPKAGRGPAWGMPAFTMDHAEQRPEMGAQFITHGSDTSIIVRKIASIRRQFRELGVLLGDDGDS